MKTLVFNLNGTLTESNLSIDPEMVVLIGKLLETNKVAIISGNSWDQVQNQLIKKLNIREELLSSLYIFPTSGSAMYQMWNKYGWVGVYQLKLNKNIINDINKVLEKALVETSWKQPEKLWGKQIENRESQITFSALGQKAPLDKKENFDPDGWLRKVLIDYLQKKLPNCDVRLGGYTSIDITLRGINKKYGVEELIKKLHISKDDVTYIGNSISKDGDDFAPLDLGLNFVKVQDSEDTKKWIISFLDNETKLEKTA